MQKIVLIGRTTKDAVFGKTKTGKDAASFTVAVNQYGKEKPEYWNCTAYGSSAEFVNKHVSKGTLVYLEGVVKVNLGKDKDGRPKIFLDTDVREIRALAYPKKKMGVESDKEDIDEQDIIDKIFDEIEN